MGMHRLSLNTLPGAGPVGSGAGRVRPKAGG